MEDIIAAIREVQEETSLPKAVKTKLDDIAAILSGPGETRLKASKALNEIEDLTDNSSVPSFVRTQLWNIASLLETL
jgi:uncharacterized protein (UPF0147 family)